eukprot:GFUD01103630.1.p1 GENE.GFUD01103630.1~~GFUD01103630.1.p1  ORF type:complete len:172 (+),score=41.57 GFUD01103630.1:73-588(+)
MISGQFILLVIFNLTYCLALEPPYIRVRDNLGEPNILGFGLNLPGEGSSVEFVDLTAHSLKPIGAPDMQFFLENGLIIGYADAEGRCVAARSMDPGSPVDCPPCDSEDPRQRWILDGHAGEEGTLVMETYPKLCLVVGQDMMEAGPYQKRPLYMEMCQVVQQEYKTWDVVG